jgi:hypothetical protein
MITQPEIDLAEVRRRLEECFGGREAVMAWMLISLSSSGQPTDVTFYRRKPILDVKVDKGLGLAMLYGISARRLTDLINNHIEFSNGTVVGLAEIWTINPMPRGGIPQAELDAVDLAEGEARVGPSGETMRQIIRETYQCRDRAEEDHFLRRFIAS